VAKQAVQGERKTLTECYAHFGIIYRPPQPLWSAVSPSGQTVVTQWTDNFDATMTQYSNIGKMIDEWKSRPENHRRRERLRAVRIGGIFKSIIVKAADPNARRLRIVGRSIGRPMRLLELRDTGEFRAEVAEVSLNA